MEQGCVSWESDATYFDCFNANLAQVKPLFKFTIITTLPQILPL